VKKDAANSFKWHLRAYNDGFRKSQYALAECYAKGRGTKKDLKKAFELHKALADEGFGKSQFYIANCYFEGIGVPRDDKKAFDWFSLGAKTGNVLCMYYTGYCYQNGLGTKTDEKKAIGWFTKAAKEGHVLSRKLVEAYSGVTVTAQEESPFEGHMNAAKAGDPDSQFIVARCYEDGIGVPADAGEAKRWYNTAAINGHFGAKKALLRLRKP
jgi:uncharacterized protein